MSETERTHPDEAALIAGLDEPADADPSVERHVSGCAACAGRVASLRAVFDEVAAEPAMPGAATLAAARERILAAVGDAPGAGRVRRFPAWALRAPALAAAAIAAVLLWSPGEEPPAGPGASLEVAATSVPIATEGEAAAEAVVAAAAAEPVGEAPGAAIALDDEAVKSLAEIEKTIPTLSAEDGYDSAALTDRFASLSEDDQVAILDELSDMTFDL